MNLFVVDLKYNPTIISEDIIEKFEKPKNQPRLKFFLEKLIEEKPQLGFTSPTLYPRFLELIKKNITTDEQEKSILSLFQKKLGLSEDVFKNNVILKGKNGATTSCSKQLIEAFSDYFKTSLNPKNETGKSCSKQLTESFHEDFQRRLQLNERQLETSESYTIELDFLSQKTLDCFKNYIITKKIQIDDKETIKELIEFSRVIDNKYFQKDLDKAIFVYFLNEKNKLDFDKTFLGKHDRLFTEEYLKRANIKIEKILDNGNYKISFPDFLKLFNDKKDLEILKFLSEKIDALKIDIVDCEIFTNLFSIPKQYREAIINIEFNISIEDCRELISFFPNIQKILFLDQDSIKKAIQDHPKDAFACALLGKILRQEDKFDEAETYMKKAIEFDPENAFAHAVLGEILEHKNKFDEAKIFLKKAIELDPKYAFAHAILADVFRQEDKFDKAETCAKKAIELDPKYAFIYAVLGEVLQRKDQWDEAKSHLKKAIELDPENNFFYSMLSNVQKLEGKLDEAEISLKKAIELDPKNAFAHIILGDILRVAGKLDEAEIFLKKAIELDPKNASAHVILGDVLRQKGQLEEAKILLRTAIELDPKNASAHSILSDVLSQTCHTR